MRNGKNSKATIEASSNVEASSGNVFVDLRLPTPDLALAKAELVQHIRGLLEDRKLTQARAAELLGLDQPKISALVRGNVAGYSIDRLFRFLNALDQQVEINVRPTPKTRPRAKSERAIVVTR